MQDGDILFTATTGAVENEGLKNTTDFALVASELAWDAVLNSLDEPTARDFPEGSECSAVVGGLG
jgi:hypothetical protein